MKRFRICLLPLLLLLLVLNPATPVLAQRPAAEATFLAGKNVSAEDLSYVEEGYALAQRYIDETHGFRLSSPTFVNIRATGAPLNPSEVGESSMSSITIFTRSAGWRNQPSFSRIGVVAHEYVHVIQNQLLQSDMDSVPAWMIEGAAEYLASDALVSAGLVDRSTADNEHLWLLAAEPDLGPLADYESVAAYQQESAAVYGLAYLGIRALAAEHGVESVTQFFLSVVPGNDWEDAFQVAFDEDPASFYAAFEAERAGYLLPTKPPLAYSDVDSQELDAPIRNLDVPASVAPGDQLIITAQSEPNARCIFYLTGASLDLVRETTVDGSGHFVVLASIPSETRTQQAEYSVDCGGGEETGVVNVRIRPAS